jgi:hypothetical protein
MEENFKKSSNYLLHFNLLQYVSLTTCSYCLKQFLIKYLKNWSDKYQRCCNISVVQKLTNNPYWIKQGKERKIKRMTIIYNLSHKHTIYHHPDLTSINCISFNESTVLHKLLSCNIQRLKYHCIT